MKLLFPAVYLGPNQQTWRNSQEIRRPDSTDIPDLADAGVAAAAPGTTGDVPTTTTTTAASTTATSSVAVKGEGDGGHPGGPRGAGRTTLHLPTTNPPGHSARPQFVVTSPALLAVPGRGSAMMPVSPRLQKILVNAQGKGDGIGDPQL